MLINGEVVISGPAANSYTIDAGTTVPPGTPLVLGVNTLTLAVEIGGIPYSDNFSFTVVDN